MQRKSGISADWARTVLKDGYQSDNKTPNRTKAKVLDKTTRKMVQIELVGGEPGNYKIPWNRDYKKLNDIKDSSE